MKWHASDKEQVVKELAVDPSRGLDSDEAVKRLAEHGRNELVFEQGPSPWKIFFQQFKDPLIVILLVGTGLSAIVGELFDALLIFTIVIFSAGLGFVQEFRAEKAVEALRNMLSPSITVLREAHEMEVETRALVPGDILILEAGDRVPADARVLYGRGLKTDEAALTGESAPVDKNAETVSSETPLAERRNLVFMGTSVVHGRGRAVVVATGMKTEFGAIARDVGRVENEKTPLERCTAEIRKWLAALSGKSAITRWTLGSVSERVIRHADRPVLLEHDRAIPQVVTSDTAAAAAWA